MFLGGEVTSQSDTYRASVPLAIQGFTWNSSALSAVEIKITQMGTEAIYLEFAIWHFG